MIAGYDYQCVDCEYCTRGKRFVRQPAIRKADGQMIIETTKDYTWAAFCTKNTDCIVEIHEYDDVCEEHGDLFCEADAFASEYKKAEKKFEEVK